MPFLFLSFMRSGSLPFSATRTMHHRSYQDAIDHLNTLQSNAATLTAIRQSSGGINKSAIPEMVEYLERIGYKTSDLNRLNVIHVTGTKGKGSTCAFVDSILQKSKPNWKIGLYTSPHLVAVRERIRVNGVPLSDNMFAEFFFHVWDRLGQASPRNIKDIPTRPNYFRFLTLLAFHVFLSLKVDATILEVGIGGTHDSTNLVPRPVVTGVSALGLDHVAVLGNTLSKIAWEKSGIFKEGVPALTVNQPEEPMQVLRQRAQDLKASKFIVVPTDPTLENIKLGIPGIHQVQNAGLAVYLARVFLQSVAQETDDPSMSETFVDGLVQTRWPGRCQTIQDPARPTLTWFVDGAHTIESLDFCIQWFVSREIAFRLDPPDEVTRFLVFNCTKRNGPSFLGAILAKIATQIRSCKLSIDASTLFEHVIFCTNVTNAHGGFKSDLKACAIDVADVTQQRELAFAWTSLAPEFPAENVHVLPSIEHAVKKIQEMADTNRARRVDVLVTGSLHLVGGVMDVAGLADVAFSSTSVKSIWMTTGS